MDKTISNPGASRQESDGFDPSRDLLGAIMRRPLLFLFALILAVGLGAIYFFKTPPTFQSTAELLVQSRQSPSFSTASLRDAADGDISTEQHTQILSSPVLMQKALDKLGVENLSSFKDVRSPVDFALENLSVSEKELGSGVLAVKYRSKDDEESFQLVSTLVECYFQFLDESSKNIGDETAGLIGKAKNELLIELKKKEEEYSLFRQRAPLLWEDGRGVNPHQLRQIELEKARADLDIERSRVVGKLKQVTDALKADNVNAVYFEAISELKANDMRDDQQLSYRETIRALSTKLTQLQLEEATLADEYAEGYPELISIRSKIATVKADVANAERAMMPFGGGGVDGVNDEANVRRYVQMYKSSLEQRVVSIDQQLTEMTNTFKSEQQKAIDLQGLIAQEISLREDIERTKLLFDSVVARLDEINIVRDQPGFRSSMLAIPKLGKRVAPGLIKTGLASLFLGTIFGAVLCVLFDIKEASFRDPMEIRKTLRLPIIGRIPMMARRILGRSRTNPGIAPQLVCFHHDDSTIAEAYRAIRTSLFFSSQGKPPKIIQVTSPMPGDGKSTLSSNLAVTIAQSGNRVILIDADFRRPTIHTIFGVEKENQSSLSSVVTGQAEVDESKLTTKIENLFLMPCGVQPNNPSELLSSPEFGTLLENLGEQFDFVIVDTPPLLAVTDPSAVASFVDGTVLAMRIRRGVRHASTAAVDLLNSVGAKVLGVVVNNIDPRSPFAKNSQQKYSYGYGYGYTNSDKSKAPTRPAAFVPNETSNTR